MTHIDNLIFNVANLNITTLNGTLNIGMTLNKTGASSGDVIVFGDEKLPVSELMNKQQEIQEQIQNEADSVSVSEETEDKTD